MARLNTHLSATPQPQPSRSSTVDSLYRRPTPLRASTARDSSYSVMSPAHSATSDKENDEPASRGNTPHPPNKAALGHRQMAAPRLPTPSSGSSSNGHANKRRRTDEYSAAGSNNIYVDEDADLDLDEQDNGEEEENDGEEIANTNAPMADEEEEFNKYYDPHQDPDIRREVRISIRNNHRELEDNRDEYTKADSRGLIEWVKREDRTLGKVKQTSDAALDARALVFASELATKRLDNSLNGNTDVGIDIDQFVSKCIFFMKNGGNAAEVGNAGSSTQARNRRQMAPTQVDGDDDDESGDGLDWALLGREACFPCNRRPAVSGFLLGPLSVQKRARAAQARRGKSQRQPTGPATRPQEITQADLNQSESSNLTHIVKGIRSQLEDHITKASQIVQEEISEDASEQDISEACLRRRLYQTPEGEASVSLFDFVVNPTSFGQTVENMFYTSFLIKEGNLRVLYDDNKLPLLVPSQPHTIEQQRQLHVQKHQAIFSIDYSTWQKLIEAFGIEEPMIPHRAEEETQVTAGGWYS